MAGPQSVSPAEPIAPFAGGKRLLARRIIGRIEAIPHKCYAEPFAGMGGVFLRRRLRPKSEIINDINGEIVNLYRILREHPAALEASLGLILPARAEWERLLRTSPDTLTDIQRAARWVFLQRQSYGGVVADRASSGDFAPGTDGPARLHPERLTRLVRRAHVRLQRVHIESLDWHDFIRRYDRPHTLFYLDPPYWGHETDYGKGMFARECFGQMAEQLAGIQGRFIMSINDRPEIRKLFTWARIEEVGTKYTKAGKDMQRAKSVTELLISG
ncbi:MAG: DNA adenine methylase [Rhodobacteraceae bacterium]|nr:DNA adenine methylase [Paracoccaceae bacterium]